MNKIYMIIIIIFLHVSIFAEVEGYYLFDDYIFISSKKISDDSNSLNLQLVESMKIPQLLRPSLISIKATEKTKNKKKQKRRYNIKFKRVVTEYLVIENTWSPTKFVEIIFKDVKHKDLTKWEETSLAKISKKIVDQSNKRHWFGDNSSCSIVFNEGKKISVGSEVYNKVSKVDADKYLQVMSQLIEEKGKFWEDQFLLTENAPRYSIKNKPTLFGLPELLVYEINDYNLHYHQSRISIDNFDKVGSTYDDRDVNVKILGGLPIIKRVGGGIGDIVTFSGEIFGKKSLIETNVIRYDTQSRYNDGYDGRGNAPSLFWKSPREERNDGRYTWDLEIKFLDIPSKSTGNSFSSFRELIPPEIIEKNFKEAENWSVFYFDSLKKDLYFRYLPNNVGNVRGLRQKKMVSLLKKNTFHPLYLKRINLGNGVVDDILEVKDPLSYVVISNKLPEGYLVICNVQKTNKVNEISISLKLYDFYNKESKSELTFNTDFNTDYYNSKIKDNHLNGIYAEPGKLNFKKWFTNPGGWNYKTWLSDQYFNFNTNISDDALVLCIFENGISKFISIDDKIHEPIILNQQKDKETIFKSNESIPQSRTPYPNNIKSVRKLDKIDKELIFQIDSYNNILIYNLKTNALERKFSIIQIKNQMLSDSDLKLLNRFYSNIELSTIFGVKIGNKLSIIDHIAKELN